MTQQHSDVQPARLHTLQLRKPSAGLLVMTAAIFVVYLVAAEIVIRTDTAQHALGAPSLGSEHTQLEQQWFRLEDYATQQPVDCIFVGDSTVMTDFAPIPFAQSYRAQTGEEATCFNFGVGALTAVGLQTLTEILNREYSPRVFIVGVQPLNFTVPEEEQGASDLSRMAWVRYKQGKFAPEGWLYAHLHLYRHLGALSQLLTLALQDSSILHSPSEQGDVVKDGYYPMEGPGPFDVSLPPDAKVAHPYLEHYFAALGAFQLLPENMDALEEILSMNGPTTRIILVEMPVPETFHAFFGHDEQDYTAFVDAISKRAATHTVPLLRMTDRELLPGEVWLNYNHLNATGAPIFSRWLGHKLGETIAARDGQP